MNHILFQNDFHTSCPDAVSFPGCRQNAKP